MSFLSRFKTNGIGHASSATLHDSANGRRRSTSGTTSASIYSVEKPPSILRKHINFPSSLNKLAAKLTSRSAAPKSAHAPVGNVASPLAYWRSRSPSPAPSLDIRMPAGLGRRASDLGERDEFEDHVATPEQHPRPARKRSISLPAAAEAARWRAANAHSPAVDPDIPPSPHPKPPLWRISQELLAFVFSYAPRPDLLSLAQVSRSWSRGARLALYDNLDLRDIDDERVEQCLSLLASNRHLASLVRKFACRDLPLPDGFALGDATSLNVVTFAIALTNMDKLHTLTLPHFDLRVLAHTTFSLQTLTLHSKSIPPEDFRSLLSWLGRHPALHTLHLPDLVLSSLSPTLLNPVDGNKDPSRPHTPHTPDTPSTPSNDSKSDTDAPSHVARSPFPATLLPKLRTLTSPVSIAAALVPGRPVARVKVPIQCTLYDGLRPSALMSALAAARDTLKVVTIQPVSTKIDQRTIERVVMSAGAELGDFLETLEVHWVLDDEILYKLVASFLSRFRALRTLALFRDSPPPHPTSPLLEFPLPPASPPLSAHRTSTSSNSSASFSVSAYLTARNSTVGLSAAGAGGLGGLGPGAPPLSARSTNTDTPFPRVHERSHLALWNKTCPGLRKVVFLSGAEWAVWPNPTMEGEAQFEFVGYAPQ